MTFTYGGRTYKFWWAHHQDPGTERFPKVRYTECFIVQLTSDSEAVEVATGDAFMSADEHTFNRSEGRKYSLARALKSLTNDREFRRTAWMAYHSRGGLVAPASASSPILIMDGAGKVSV